MSPGMEPTTAREALAALVWPVYVPSVLHSIGSTAILPVVPLLALRLGYGVSAAALLTVVMGIIGVIGPIPVGAVMQRLGERPALVATGALLALTNLGGWWMIEHATRPATADRIGFVVILAMMALTQQVWALGRQSYLGSTLPARFRARGMSTFGGMMRIGQIIGPALGALVISAGHLAWVYLLDLVTITAATLLVACCMVPGETRGNVGEAQAGAERIRPGEPSPFAPGRPALSTMLLASLGVTPLVVGRFARQTIIPLAGVAWGVSEAQISLVFAVAAAVEIIVFAPAGVIMDRYGRAAVAVPCLLVMGVGYLGLGLATPWLEHADAHVAALALGAAACLMAVGNGMGSGIVMTLGVDFSPEHARTRHLARWQTIQGLGRLVAPVLVSAVTLVAPVSAAGAVTGLACLAGGCWLWTFLPGATPRVR